MPILIHCNEEWNLGLLDAYPYALKTTPTRLEILSLSKNQIIARHKSKSTI